MCKQLDAPNYNSNLQVRKECVNEHEINHSADSVHIREKVQSSRNHGQEINHSVPFDQYISRANKRE